jgi:hypothetical protein
MARSSSANKDSTRPLVIALVFFILATIGLGVGTYMGFSNASKAEATADEANKKAAALTTEKDKNKEIANYYRSLIGVATPEERTSVDGSQYKNEFIAERAKITDFLAKNDLTAKALLQAGVNDPNSKAILGQVLQWNADPNVALPKSSLLESALSAHAGQILFRNKSNDTQKNYETIKEAAGKAISAYEQAKAEYEKATKEFPNKIAENAQQFESKIKATQEQFTKDMDVSRKAIQTASDENNKITEEKNKVDGTNKNLRTQIDGLNAEKDAQSDPFQYDKSAGKITSRAQGSKQIEVNLGSTDFIKPGIRFSVQPADTIDQGLQKRLREFRNAEGKKEYRIQAKGNIEIIEVTGPHSSTARITDEADETRERIMAGDLLYNVAWRKGAADHVALFGIFDLNADGIDDITEVVNRLNAIGIVVDAYYDLGKGVWVGKVTERTIYAIEGYVPVLKGFDGNSDIKGKIITQLDEAKKYCKERGSKITKIRDFFPRIGYEVNLGITDDRINQAASKYFYAQKDSAAEAEKKDGK